VPVVRVTNSGISAVLNQVGAIVPDSRLPQFEPFSVSVEVSPSAAALGLLLPREQGLLALGAFALVRFGFGKRGKRIVRSSVDGHRHTLGFL